MMDIKPRRRFPRVRVFGTHARLIFIAIPRY
jgi:hypothetical protein